MPAVAYIYVLAVILQRHLMQFDNYRILLKTKCCITLL